MSKKQKIKNNRIKTYLVLGPVKSQAGTIVKNTIWYVIANTRHVLS